MRGPWGERGWGGKLAKTETGEKGSVLVSVVDRSCVHKMDESGWVFVFLGMSRGDCGRDLVGWWMMEEEK